jgi:nucleotide-binding universal stress UspA family protein
MYRRIAVPLDSTPESRSALPWAVTLARKADCPLELINVALPRVYGTDLYTADDLTRLELEAEVQLRDIANEVVEGGVEATAVVLRGGVPQTLSDHLRESGADLVVMATHDRGWLEHLILGSVGEAVVKRAHVPTLLVRPSDDVPDSLDAPAGVGLIVVPHDGSSFAVAILPHVAHFASLMKARVTILGVVEPILASAAAMPGIGEPMGAVLPPIPDTDQGSDAERRELESRELARTAESLRGRGIDADVVVLVDGQSGRAIVDYAATHGADLIAMTTHGRGALKRLVAGSVSQHVLRHASTPVLMYRPEKVSDG